MTPIEEDSWSITAEPAEEEQPKKQPKRFLEGKYFMK